MIKTELEWHSNKETPDPSKHWNKYLILPLDSEFECVEAWFVDDEFKHFYALDGETFTLDAVICWAALESSTNLTEAFAEDDAKSVVDVINRASAILKEPVDESFIVANMIQCALCKDVIESHSRHDFVSCSCSACSVDGGMDYLRRVGERGNIIELSVYSTDDYESIRTHFKRGSRGIKRDKPLHWIPLKDMTDEHLLATINYEDPNNKFLSLYERELSYRVDPPEEM